MLKYFSEFLALLLISFLIMTGCNKDEHNTENHLPVAAFEVDAYRGDVNTVFQFDGSKVSDFEDSDESLEIRWDWNNDGIYDTEFSTVKIVAYQYSQTGLYFPLLQVRDSKGMADSIRKMVVVVNDINNQTPEVPYVVFPEDWQVWIDTTIYFKWKCAGDPENDPLTFDIWIGNSEDNLQPEDNITVNTEIFNNEQVYVTHLSGFDYETTYFWQIYVKDPNGNYTPGPVWRFKTKPKSSF
ncbi:MAG: hypothetical protein K0B15_05100 [Lentimicrobium sp.]|nr:hypothetical protein [Lentimicrobium sp.]